MWDGLRCYSLVRNTLLLVFHPYRCYTPYRCHAVTSVAPLQLLRPLTGVTPYPYRCHTLPLQVSHPVRTGLTPLQVLTFTNVQPYRRYNITGKSGAKLLNTERYLLSVQEKLGKDRESIHVTQLVLLAIAAVSYLQYPLL